MNRGERILRLLWEVLNPFDDLVMLPLVILNMWKQILSSNRQRRNLYDDFMDLDEEEPYPTEDEQNLEDTQQIEEDD
jgi:hypothetical protein